MAFSFAVTDPTGNTASTATVSLYVSPTSAIITASNMTPGQSVSGIVYVSNTGTVDEYWQTTINWSPTGSTSTAAATRLADELHVSVTAGSPTATTPVFAGTLYSLIDQPGSPGQPLPLSLGTENVQFAVSLPASATAPYEGIDMGFDIVFVALS